MLGALNLFVFSSAVVAATCNLCSDGTCDEISFVQKHVDIHIADGKGPPCDTWTEKGSHYYLGEKTWLVGGGHQYCFDGDKKMPQAEWCHGYSKDECIAWCKDNLECDYLLWRNSARTCYLYRSKDAPMKMVANNGSNFFDHHLVTCVTREAVCPTTVPENGAPCKLSDEHQCTVQLSTELKVHFYCQQSHWYVPCPAEIPEEGSTCEHNNELCEYSKAPLATGTIRFKCDQQQWVLACPSEIPTSDTPCNGGQCEYPNAPLQTGTTYAFCIDGMWQTFCEGCPTESPKESSCPKQIPINKPTCEDEGKLCTYSPSTAGTTDFICTQGKWIMQL